MGDTGNKRCFVICPIGIEGSPERDHSDQVLKCLIKPIVETELGYSVIRADQIAEPGLITRQIIDHLREDELVIADLTGHNPNVFYELAIRDAVRKPVVRLIRAGEKIPFDVGQSRTIEFDVKRWDSLDKTTKEFLGHINFAIEHPEKIDNLISASAEFAALRANATGDVQERLITMIDGLSSTVRSLEQKMELQRRTWSKVGQVFVSDATRRALGLPSEEDLRRNAPSGLLEEEDLRRPASSAEDVINQTLDVHTHGAAGHSSSPQ